MPFFSRPRYGFRPRYFSFFSILVFFWTLCCPASAPQVIVHAAVTPSDSTDFPLYPCIKPNVDFWVAAFTRYDKSHGIIHDTRNLSIIYEVVSLDPAETSVAQDNNQKIKKAAIEKYRTILSRLSRGGPPVSKEERRVAAFFGLGAKYEAFELAASNIRCQTGLSNEFKAGLIRSGAVIDEFKRIFKSYGLPEDLVYLPHVESSFNFKAYSKLGAAGIWQFTHGTGKMFMEIDYVVDERRDPYLSTDAAARLLKKNHAVLGNWPMAITAYNHGLNGMVRAQKTAGTYEKIFQTYQTSSFKFASRNFYSEFLAARKVAKNYQTYFGPLNFQKPVRFQTIQTKGFLEVKDLSRIFNIGVQDIQELNPSLRPPVFSGQKYIPKGFHLKLPIAFTLPDIQQKLAGVYRGSQNPSRFHRVQKGDTASSIARRYTIRLDELIRANNLNQKGAIYIGQNLRIPVKGEVLTAVREPVKTLSPKSVQEKNAVEIKAAQPIFQPAAAEPIEKEPVSGVMAEPVKDVTAVNPYIVTSDLKILKIINQGGHSVGTIKIEAEETLGHYADWLKVPAREIRVLNGFKPDTPISIDQKILIPLKKTTAQRFEEQRYEFHKEMEEDFFSSFSIQGVAVYEIKEGDNFWRICSNDLEIPFWLVRKYNPGIDFNQLRLKQKIQYPIVSRVKEG